MESRKKKTKIAVQVLVILSVICAIATILVISPGIIYVYKIDLILSGVPLITYLVPIGCAILIAILGIVGWCGALDIHKSCIFWYVVGTLLVMGCQLYLTVFYNPSRSNPYITKARKEIEEAWEKHEQDGTIKKNYRHLEVNWECCGLHSYKDYNQSDLPISCCHNLKYCTVRDAYHKGCLNTYSTDLFTWLKNGFVVVVFSCCIQMITTVFSCSMLFVKIHTHADIAVTTSPISVTQQRQVETRSAATTPTMPAAATISPGEVRAKILAAIEQRRDEMPTSTMHPVPVHGKYGKK